ADVAPALVVEHLWRDEPDGTPSRAQLAASGGQDVFDPVSVRPVGERNDVPVADRKHIDWGLVDPAGAPAAVHDEAKARHPGGDVPGDSVQPDLVPLPDEPWNGHPTATSRVRAIRARAAVLWR